MKDAQVEKLYEMTGNDTRKASVTLTGDEMVSYVGDCLNGVRDRFSMRRENNPETALAYLDALRKLKYEGKALNALKKYFKAQVTAQALRAAAQSALYQIQDQQHQRGAKNRGEKTVAAY